MSAEDKRNPREIIEEMKMYINDLNLWKTPESASKWSAFQMSEMARVQLGIAELQERSARTMERFTRGLFWLTIVLFLATVDLIYLEYSKAHTELQKTPAAESR